jgi:hypothetical protein
MARWSALLLVAATIPASAAGLKDGSDCGGFTVADAAGFLKAPAAQVTRNVEKSGKTLWLCSFAVNRAAPAIAFSIEVEASAKSAAEEMNRYRDHLMTAGDTPRYKNKLPKGAYSEIVGVGDDSVWTDINETFTVRKGNVRVQVTLPREKMEKIRLGKAIVDKL